MQSRMDKYTVKERKKYERTKKNTKLYEEVYDDLYKDTTYQNMEVIDSAKEININRLKDMLDDKYDLMRHPNIRLTEDGGAAPYDYTQAKDAADDLGGDWKNYEILDELEKM